jgi:hypothetical protein
MAITQADKEALFAEWNEQHQNAERIFNEKSNEDSFSFGGKLISCNASQPRPKIDKATNEPILDSKGQPTFWDSVYWCEIQQLGKTRKYSVSVELGKDLNVGSWYTFSGENGDENVRPKVKLITLLR